jgi:energy-coupling factor transporter ATP-binding protein EcfA2
MDEKGVTARERPSPGDGPVPAGGMAAPPAAGGPRAADGASAAPAASGAAGASAAPVSGEEPAAPVPAVRPLPRMRVDARLLEAALLNLRKRVAAIPLALAVPGTEEAAAERAKILSQIDDYLLPRVRRSAAPILVALVGSTGAGKSTLVNSIVGTRVSLTGIRRPTTNSPVLTCHPDDAQWFAENMFLPTLPRVRQEGLARPGRDGLLVLAPVPQMARGIALLDTPDIDSVAASHREFAYQFLDASDLWLFMTSASRYADAPVWEILQHARERGASLSVVLSRVPPAHRDEIVAHFDAMLGANGITAGNRFVIPETAVADGMLPAEVLRPVRDWLTDTARREDRRVAVLSQTMAGVLDTFKTRVPKLAAHVDAQAGLATRLRLEAESAYASALAEFSGQVRGAHLLRGQVLARWQDYVASGDLDAELRGRRAARRARRGRAGAGVSRGGALDAALRSAVESLAVSVADRAAEQVTRAWRDEPAGAALLSSAEASWARGEQAERVFESAFGAGGDGRPAPAPAAPGLGRSAPDLAERVARAVSAWQDQLIRPADADARRRPEAGTLALVTFVAVLADGGDPEDGPAAEPRQVLGSALSPEAARALITRARGELVERIRLAFDEELLRFTVLLDEAGDIDPVAAVRLYQAEYSLEAAR